VIPTAIPRPGKGAKALAFFVIFIKVMRLSSHWVLEVRVNSLTATTLPHVERESFKFVVGPGVHVEVEVI